MWNRIRNWYLRNFSVTYWQECAFRECDRADRLAISCVKIRLERDLLEAALAEAARFPTSITKVLVESARVSGVKWGDSEVAANIHERYANSPDLQNYIREIEMLYSLHPGIKAIITSPNQQEENRND